MPMPSTSSEKCVHEGWLQLRRKACSLQSEHVLPPLAHHITRAVGIGLELQADHGD